MFYGVVRGMETVFDERKRISDCNTENMKNLTHTFLSPGCVE